MKRFIPAVLPLTLALSLVLAAPAAAGNVHLKGGKNAEPSFTDNPLSLSASGELAGLGNGEVVFRLDGVADVTTTCANNGAHAAPGQNPAPITVSGSTQIPEDEVKNGNTPFSVDTYPPDSEVPNAPDCPNPNWVETIDDLAFTSATITVEQPEGTLVLTVECTFDPATTDGSVHKNDVECVQIKP